MHLHFFCKGKNQNFYNNTTSVKLIYKQMLERTPSGPASSIHKYGVDLKFKCNIELGHLTCLKQFEIEHNFVKINNQFFFI